MEFDSKWSALNDSIHVACAGACMCWCIFSPFVSCPVHSSTVNKDSVISTMAIKKKSAHKSSIRKRHLALRTQQAARSTYLKSCSLILIILCVRFRNNPNARLIDFTRLVVAGYFKATYNSNIQWNLPAPLRWHNSFDSFSPD
jgi:hypothetical protein